ncbi:unnamed protein product [Peronospora destructor]|uniref:Uncharacterized protein n=1 Tax=Peronospora destructor TaxID=86335 RepID=A0AAV0VE92_9STRA|nr:unnamed protein product [Peronospora destructor]
MLSSLIKRRSRHPTRANDVFPDHETDTSAALVVSLSSVDSITQQIAVLEHAVAHTTIPGETQPRRRRTRRLSKNCRTLSKFGPMHAHFRRIQSLKIDSNQTQLRRKMLAMHEQILALERRQTLLSALYLARRTNAFQLVSDKVRAYYQSFSHGYDPTQSNAWESEAKVRSMVLPDVESLAFRDLDAFFVQWHNFTRYHAELTQHCEQIQPLESDDPDVYPVRCVGRFTLRISRDTIRHFFQPLLNDEELVQRLVGKTYNFPFESRFYFNSTGRAFKWEPRIEVVSGIVDLVVDPFTTVRVLGASNISEDGYLHAYVNQDDAS